MLEQWLGAHPEPVIIKDPRLAFTWPVWKASTKRECLFGWTDRETESQVASIVRWYKVPEASARLCIAMHDMCARMACEEHRSLTLDMLDEDRDLKGKQFVAQFVEPAGETPDEA